jgi:hypothetical protein
VPRRLHTVVNDFSKCVQDSRGFAADAYSWSIITPPATSPLINTKRRDSLTELAFFRVFSAWEAFLEESFILYMLGQKAPKGRKIHRYGFPPNEDAAYEWVNEGRPYAKWTPDDIKPRAKRLFRDGKPFSQAITNHHNLLFQVKTVRNAIAHDSASARDKFEEMVRNELRTLPPNTTVGSFLLTTKPRTTPPISFFEFYLDSIIKVADEIVPT